MDKRKNTHECIFRVKRVSSDRPRVGMPDAVRPGDLVVFFDGDKAFTTRTVESVHKGHVVVAPMVHEGRVLDKSHEVLSANLHEAWRPIAPPSEKLPEISMDVMDVLSGDGL